MSDTLNTQSESMAVTPAEPEPAPAEAMVIVSCCQAFIISYRQKLPGSLYCENV